MTYRMTFPYLVFVMLVCVLSVLSVRAIAQEPEHLQEVMSSTIIDKIDYLIVLDLHQTSRPWSGYFLAMNGRAYNVSPFYETKTPELNAKSAIEIYRSGVLKLSIPIHFDNGWRADLYQADRFLGLGLSAYYAPTRKDLITLHLLDIVQLGGQVTEQPCYDSFRREFHCGSGNPWSDVKGRLDGRTTDARVKISWRQRF